MGRELELCSKSGSAKSGWHYYCQAAVAAIWEHKLFAYISGGDRGSCHWAVTACTRTNLLHVAVQTGCGMLVCSV